MKTTSLSPYSQLVDNSLLDPFTFFGLRPYNSDLNRNMMNIDIQEVNNVYDIKVDLPGIDKNNILVNIEKGYLNISAERRNLVESKDTYYSERSYGSFSRSVKLPRDVDEDTIKAFYKDGVLEITLSKTDKSVKGKYIEIQ